MANNDSGNFAGSLVEQIIAAEAVIKLTDVNVMMPLVTEVSTTNADTVTIPLWNSGSAADDVVNAGDIGTHTEGTPMSAKKLKSEKVTATLDSMGVNIPIYDEAQFSSIENLADRVATIGANAVSEKIDDMLTDIVSAASTTVGTSTTNLALAELFEALGTLKSNSAPGPYNLVHKPEAIYKGLMSDLGTSGNTPGAVSISEQASAAGFATTVAGIGIYSSSTVNIVSTSFATGGVFPKEALMFAYNTPVLKVEAQREATDLKTDYVFSMFSDAVALESDYLVGIKSKFTV